MSNPTSQEEKKPLSPDITLATMQKYRELCTERIHEDTAAAPDLLDVLAKLVGDLDELIASSHGVYGLHSNGDGSPWGELTAGGRFEGWLTSLEVARTTLSLTNGTPAPIEVSQAGGQLPDVVQVPREVYKVVLDRLDSFLKYIIPSGYAYDEVVREHERLKMCTTTPDPQEGGKPDA